MKKYFSLIKVFFFFAISFVLNSCVHDDEYAAPNNATNYQCQDLTATKTLAEVKALYANNTATITTEDVIEGYVSSTDETGNIYKTIFIQDALENPTQGLIISVDAVSTYTKFPQGSKIYVKLKGLAFGKYGGVLQLGNNNTDGFGRIPEANIGNHIFRSCGAIKTVVPKVMTLAQLSTADALIGALIQVDNAQFGNNLLCNVYAPAGTSVDRQLVDPTSSTSNRVARNSGYASFASKTLPTGNGTFIGILSKYNSTYQFYINRDTDLKMTGPRLDGTTPTCTFNTTGATLKTIAEVKALSPTGATTQITQDFYAKAKVIANDRTGNLYKYIYVEDATGGIRINIDMLNMYADPRFYVGKELLVNLKGLYVGKVNGEYQLGELFGTNVGRILPANIYKYLFGTDTFTQVVPTEKTITSLTYDDVGKWIKIKDLQFIASDLGKTYSPSGTTSRTLEDCSGNKIALTTSSFANFGEDPVTGALYLATNTEIDGGKGDVYGVLSYYNGNYQIWITNLLGADLDGPRCDGTVYIPYKTVFSDDFSSGLAGKWTTVSVIGAQSWTTSNQGTGSNYYAVMNGFSGGAQNNEDWLITKEISLAGFTDAYLNFESDVRYNGNPIQVFATENYTGNPATTTWTTLNPTLDTNTGAFGDWVSSGNVSLASFANKKVFVAFKYTSTTSGASTWEIDNVKVKAR